MTETRKNVVKQAFQMLDKEGKGFVELDVLKKSYCPQFHPRVLIREKTPEEVFVDFDTAITGKA
jgi:hypothetical protein